MELKRILAKDTRSANEEATSLYGGDVMVISCSKVGSQTELIVAIDTDTPKTHCTADPAFSTQTFTPNTGTEQEHPFAQVFEMVKQPPDSDMNEPVRSEQASALIQKPLTTAHALASSAQEAMERVRGQELVSLVRDEIASLRREFQLSRLGQEQGNTIDSALPVRLLNESLIECHAPVALRASLINGFLECSELNQALENIRAQLGTILYKPASATPSLLSGTHALIGPSGSGKTMMAYRILQAASRELAIEDMALVSFADHKPGAWNQVQILAAQSGVDVYRARDLHALPLLLEELGNRRLIIIDTSGSEPLRQGTELSQLNNQIALHLVLPTDASPDQYRHLNSMPDLKWASLMLSKADEQRNPWPLLGFLSNASTPISALAKSDRIQDGLASQVMDELVEWAMYKLQNTLDQTAAAGIQMPALLPRDVAKPPGRVSKPRTTKTAKSKPQSVKSTPTSTCLQ
jgi:flagellar biosynthesis GTPase FlhF